jgi:1D-myo-inositol 3-kinase
LRYDYTTLGHVTIDVLADGTRQPGGTAFYGALQAARLGLRTLILTRGRAGEIEELLEPYAAELELRVLPAPHTTTLETEGEGSTRRQRLLAWAGRLPADLELDTAILHLAPVAREIPTTWRGRAEFVGLTPQGLARRWEAADGEITVLAPERPGAAGMRPLPPVPVGAGPAAGEGAALELAGRCRAIVVSEHEHAACAALIDAGRGAGALVAITAGAEPNTLVLPDGRESRLPVPRVEDARDDLGAGDVFASAFFVALAEGREPEPAVAFANAAAAVRMQGIGAQAIGERRAIEAEAQAGASSPGRL